MPYEVNAPSRFEAQCAENGRENEVPEPALDSTLCRHVDLFGKPNKSPSGRLVQTS